VCKGKDSFDKELVIVIIEVIHNKIQAAQVGVIPQGCKALSSESLEAHAQALCCCKLGQQQA